MPLHSSKDHLFARLERLRRRALFLLDEAPVAPRAADDAAEVRRSLEAGVELRIPILTDLFELTPLGVDALLCLVAAEYDPLFRVVIRTLQRDAGVPWLELGTITELLDLPASVMPELASLFAPDGIFTRQALARVEGWSQLPAAAVRVKAAGRVAEFLAGIDRLPAGIRRAPVPSSQDSLAGTADREAARVRLQRALLDKQPCLIEIAGPEGCGKQRLAAQLAADLGRVLIIADLARVETNQLEALLAESRREATLSGALLCLAHADAHVVAPRPSSDEDTPAVTGLPRLAPALARFFEALEAPLLVTVREPQPLFDSVAPTLMLLELAFPTPSQRATLLARHLDGDLDLELVASRFALDPARLAAAARAALERAERRGPGEPVTVEDLSQACQRQLRHDLASVAARVSAGHRWEDLVVAAEVHDGLREMVDYARHAERVYDTWGFGERHGLSRGISALFAGPPGTGKTMCASVMARELDMELFRVDLSRVVSKWIGETEKNLNRVFDEAQRSNAIILFDEADSLFAKRTEVKSSVDRYANLEVNFLLQRMEAFSGVTILTTNFENTIDTAFKRRLSFRLCFEKPDAAARAALWEKMFPADSALSPDVSFEELGHLYELSGGNIRNAAVRAAFLAAGGGHDIDMYTCMLAAEKEAREMGLLVRSHLELIPLTHRG